MAKGNFRTRSQLVRLFVMHWAIGFFLSALFVATILFFNFGGLGRMMLKEPLTIFMLWFFAGTTFGGAQTAMTVMSMTDDESGGGGSKTPEVNLTALAARAAQGRASRP